MDRVNIILGRLIKEKRKEIGMSQSLLAEKVGVTTQRIYYYEKGNRVIFISLLFKICDVLNIDWASLKRTIEDEMISSVAWQR